MFFLSAPAQLILELSAELSFLGLLIILFLLMFAIFSYLRSRIDDPPPRYVSYIKFQIYLPIAVEILMIFSYLCLLLSEPQATHHIFTELGTLILSGFSIFLGCEIGGFFGIVRYHKDNPSPPWWNTEDEESKDNQDDNRKD